jgi:hypothetical protein
MTADAGPEPVTTDRRRLVPAAPASYRGGDDQGALADPPVLARELAANDWQVRDKISADGGAGIEADRNVLLAIDWPRPVSRIG